MKNPMKPIYKALKKIARGIEDVDNTMNTGVLQEYESDAPLRCFFRKINPNVQLPERKGTAYDLFLPEDVHIEAGETVHVPLGFACKLPMGESAFLLMRSSTWKTWGVCLGNQIGLWDGEFCGDDDEVGLILYRPNSYKDYPTTIPAGTRIAQFVTFRNRPSLKFEVVEHLPDQTRGGFGSTGL